MNYSIQLKILRKKIDEIDLKLIKILAERFKVTKKIRMMKLQNDLPIEDKEREQKIMENTESLASRNKISPDLVKKILKLIIDKVKEGKNKEGKS